ncbi:Arg80p [Saccharomyces cerevisiae YJM1252]|uniref:Arg80p n=1 Tax=Saccharomyces paradoxus TaxID=27291 RepID=A0A8B8UXA5_SACPA|nr:Arg80 [Saccharomyces paradoxus]AJS81134.1 Arg80p [Saccharomyces cerevisiae YJM1252]QHS75321.1 Arg80 [Saccharomyces paradoxus]
MTSNSDGSSTSLEEKPMIGDVGTNGSNKPIRRLSTPSPDQDQDQDQDQDGDFDDEDDDDKFSVSTSTPTPTITKTKENSGTSTTTRQKQPIKYIENKTRRHVTFSKRRHGIMKKAYELSVLTGANILLLILANSGLVYTFTTPKLEPVVRETEGKSLIRACINASDTPDAPDTSPAQEQSPAN